MITAKQIAKNVYKVEVNGEMFSFSSLSTLPEVLELAKSEEEKQMRESHICGDCKYFNRREDGLAQCLLTWQRPAQCFQVQLHGEEAGACGEWLRE